MRSKITQNFSLCEHVLVNPLNTMYARALG